MNFGKMLAGLQEWWRSQGKTRKIVLILAGAGTLAVLVFLVQLAFRPTYAPLFTQLDPKEAGQIVEELKAMKVPYRITSGGTTVEVPEDKVYEVRIQLASAGVLSSSGVGFELFDEKKFGITEFEQQVGYQRALQEELRRTIVQLEEVEQARVHLVLPRRSVFLEQEAEPSASIVLKLKPLAKLEPNQVQGICDLVVGSVEGLKPENVHIIDTQGNVLSDVLRFESEGQWSAQKARDQYEVKRAVEKEMESRVRQMLDRIYGPGKAVVMVTAEMDFSQRESTSTVYGPGSVLSQQTVKERGTGGAASGVPGSDSEMPGQSIPFAGGTNNETYSREEVVTNYQVDVHKEKTAETPGKIKRLSVAVVVNGNYRQQELNDIQQVVASAVGYSAERGDQIIVSSMPFDDSLQQQMEEAAAKEEAAAERERRLFTMAAIAGGALLALIILVLVLLVVFRRRARREEEVEEVLLDRYDVEEEAEPVAKEELAKTPRSIIKEMAREKPQEVAEIIKLWLKE